MGVESGDALHIKGRGFEFGATHDGLTFVTHIWDSLLSHPVALWGFLGLAALAIYLNHRRAIKRDQMKEEFAERRRQARVTGQMNLPLNDRDQAKIEDGR